MYFSNRILALRHNNSPNSFEKQKNVFEGIFWFNFQKQPNKIRVYYYYSLVPNNRPPRFFSLFFEKVTKLWKITSPGKQVKFVFHDSLHSNIPSNRIVQINLLRKIYSILLRKVSIVLIQHISKIFVSFKPYGPRQAKILSPVYSDRHRLIDFAIFCNPTVN